MINDQTEISEQTDRPVEFRHRRQMLDMLRAYRQSYILITCTELGVFEALSEGPLTAEEVAGGLEIPLKGIALLLNAAAGLGLLAKQEGRFSNSALVETCLARPGKHYLGNFVRREGAFYRRWGNLSDAVRTGKRPEESVKDEDPSNWVRGFEYALYDLSRAIAPYTAEALALPQDRPLKALDVGGGHGGYSLALARRYPKLTATVFELPQVVPVSREIIANEGLQDRVSVQEGDFQKDDLGSGYDLVMLFGVMVGESPEGRARLIRKVYSALKPGGKVAVREFLLNPDLCSPPEAAMFALQMLLATESGGASTTEEMEGWLKEAGFGPLQTIHLPEYVGTILYVAEKPE
jgi:SAM-dependent methyltransferase